MPVTSREWRLIARPDGTPTAADVELTTVTLDDPAPGQALIRNDWMSVDPYMRSRMNAGDGYLPPFELGVALTGAAVGTVIASASDALPVGAVVSHFDGWREYTSASWAQLLDVTSVPPQAYLGVLGTTGLTAYAGLTEVAKIAEGDVVFVSAAAGAVGSIAGQLARTLGAKLVIGSAGGPEKSRKLVEQFGFDAAIDYRAGDVAGQLAAAAPGGIDIYFDNVGGEQLDAALGAIKVNGRVVLSGSLTTIDATALPPGPKNLPLIIGKRVSLYSMNAADYFAVLPDYISQAKGWLLDGTLRAEETVFDGIENAFTAYSAMIRGENVGKTLVSLSARPA
ncbi:NADP-dependent oxidoreductase [Nocardia sp. NPDC058705]|uniref:NADP-dependent oxidoreductase n=1 Tax=Nocardia sp. NPDC058705 TaxID=3346609 RepID=UPI0036AF1FAB